MSAATLATVQTLARDCLLAHASFAGLDIFLELEEGADAAALAQFESQFDTAMATKGISIVILCPELATIDKADHSGLSGSLNVAVAICEVPEVNRGAADEAANPPRSPANKSARLLVEAAAQALLPQFHFPAQPAGRPTWADGFWAYYLVAQRRHLIRALS